MFDALPIALNLMVYGVLATCIWQAGTRLSYYIDAIAEQTQLARGFLGLVLLASATELPEVVTVLTASSHGLGTLALNNMFGGMLLQIVVLAVADVFVSQRNLTSHPRNETVIVAGLLSILSLSILLFFHFVDDQPLLGHVGMGSISVGILYFSSMLILKRSELKNSWSPVDLPNEAENRADRTNRYDNLTVKHLAKYSLVAAAVIFISGFLVVRVSETLADQTGLGSSFIGVSLLALTTSLPELSTSIAAIKVRAYSMAISNIFGSNLIMTFLLLPADLFFTDGPILLEIDNFAALSLVAGIFLTTIFCIGFLTRPKLKFIGFGIDSLAVLMFYALHLINLYRLR